MPFAITLALDDAGATHIEALWRALSAEGVSSSMLALGYGAHLTLGLFAELDAELARQVLATVAAGRRALPITFAGLGLFKGPRSVLFAGPVVTRELLDLHTALHEAIRTSAHEHYRIGAWVPHCTLADDLDETRALEALRAVSQRWSPFKAMASRLELVEFTPVRIIQVTALQGGSCRPSPGGQSLARST